MDSASLKPMIPLTHDSTYAIYGRQLCSLLKGGHHIASIPEASPEALGLVDGGGALKVSSEKLKNYCAFFQNAKVPVHAARCTTSLGRHVIAVLIEDRYGKDLYTLYKANGEVADEGPDYVSGYCLTDETGKESKLSVFAVKELLIKRVMMTVAKALENPAMEQAAKKIKK